MRRQTIALLIAILLAATATAIITPQVAGAASISTVSAGTQSPSPVIAGASGTYSITSTWSGNGGQSATLSVTSWSPNTPAGVTPTFSPTTVSKSSTTSTLTIATTSSTPAGSYTFVVHATGGAGSANSAPVTFTVAKYSAVTMIISYSYGGSSPDAPVFHYTDTSGTSQTYTLTTTAHSITTVGAGTAWSVTRADGTSATTLSGSTSTEQWITTNTLSGTAPSSGSDTKAFAYTHQYKVTFNVNPTDAGTTIPATGDQWYDAGSTNAISASPSTDYQFKSWSATDSISFTDNTVASTSAQVKAAGTITANFELTPKATTLTVACDPDTVAKGSSMQTTVQGTLESDGSGVSNKDIALSYNDGSGWQTIGTAKTQSDGSYSLSWTVPSNLANGFYVVHAVFTGDNQPYQSIDAATTSASDGGGLFVVPEYALGALGALGICFAGFVISKKPLLKK